MKIKAILAGVGAFFVGLSVVLLKILFKKNEKIEGLKEDVKKEEVNKEALKEFNEEEREINKKKEETSKKIEEAKTDEEAFKIATDIISTNNKWVRKSTKKNGNATTET